MILCLDNYIKNGNFDIKKKKINKIDIDEYKYIFYSINNKNNKNNKNIIKYEIKYEEGYYYDIEIIVKASSNNSYTLNISDGNIDNQMFDLDIFKRVFKFELYPTKNIDIQFIYSKQDNFYLELYNISISKKKKEISKLISTNYFYEIE